MKELLISVTNFFRDPAAFARAREARHPAPVREQGPRRSGAGLGAGCATGEEAYSLAMLLAEHAAAAAEPPAVQVFATDLDERGDRDGARRRSTPTADVADVSEERLQRFFHPRAGRLPGAPRAARAGAVRAPQRHQGSAVLAPRSDLVPQPADLPESRRPGAAARDVPLRAAARAAICSSARRSRPTSAASCSCVVDKAAHIYESRTASRAALPAADHPGVPGTRAPLRVAEAAAGRAHLPGRPAPAAARAVRAAVAGRDRRPRRRAHVGARRPLPADARRRAVARPAALVRPELRADLRTALHQAARERRERRRPRQSRSCSTDGDRRVDISVQPVLRDGDPARGFFLVLFDEQAPADQSPRDVPTTLTSPAEPVTQQLEEELARLQGAAARRPSSNTRRRSRKRRRRTKSCRR